ncbi:MAG: hypothetical protein HQL21_00005, partial [Candidatus Omnitrophica bacterium]|nr:hypothetical protein [Candidatus Omnitrophota bacterium]
MKTVLSVLFLLFATLSLSYAEVPQPDENGNIIINGDFTLAPGEVLNAPGNIIINGNVTAGMP